MKAVCNSTDLQKALSFVMGFVGKSSVNVIHRKLYIQFTDDHVLLRAANGITYAQVKCSSEITETEDQAYLIDAITFSSIVSTCRDDPIKFAYGGKTTRLRVTQEGLRRRLATEDVEDFPSIPKVGDENSFDLSISELAHYITTIGFAASTVYETPILRGILFDSKNNSLMAADGMRLATISFPMEISTEVVVIPETLVAITNLLRVVDTPDIVLKYGDAGWIEIAGDTASIWVGTLGGVYPAKGNTIVQTLLNRDDVVRIKTTKDTLSPVLNMASVYAGIAAQEQSSQGVTISIEDKTLRFSIKTIGGGMDDQLHDQDIEGPNMIILVNPQQLHQAIMACPTEEITLRMFSPFEPIVITSSDENIGWTVVQTPMGSKEVHAKWEEAQKQFDTEPMKDDDDGYDDF